MFPVLNLCYKDPTQPLTTACKELDDLDHDLSDLSRGVKQCHPRVRQGQIPRIARGRYLSKHRTYNHLASGQFRTIQQANKKNTSRVRMTQEKTGTSNARPRKTNPPPSSTLSSTAAVAVETLKY